MITQARLKELFDYDALTGDLINRKQRGNSPAGKAAYRVMWNGYKRITVEYKQYAAHRLIWMLHYGEFPKHDIDHINGIRGDNRIENLREATRSQNMQNEKKARSPNKVGLLGVCAHGSNYRAQITIDGKCVRLGTHKTPEKAHEAYLQAKKALHPYQTIA
jgi:hypothetical protein